MKQLSLNKTVQWQTTSAVQNAFTDHQHVRRA